MKIIILCGGTGTRLREETEYKPKPLVEIGGMPILWHIMKHYGGYGIKEFYLALGYKGGMIKEYFMNFDWMSNDFTLDLKAKKETIIHPDHAPEDWRITFADTGLKTPTGGRIKRMQKYIQDDLFMATYGDGVSNVDIRALLDFHKEKGKIVTLTGVHPSSPFGVLESTQGVVTSFKEKPHLEGLINGGFFVFDKRIFDYLDDDSIFEEAPLRRLAEEKQLAVYQHHGFWACMDTFKDVERLNAVWSQGTPPWKTWQE